jgi:hypothetical protein
MRQNGVNRFDFYRRGARVEAFKFRLPRVGLRPFESTTQMCPLRVSVLQPLSALRLNEGSPRSKVNK